MCSHDYAHLLLSVPVSRMKDYKCRGRRIGNLACVMVYPHTIIMVASDVKQVQCVNQFVLKLNKNKNQFVPNLDQDWRWPAIAKFKTFYWVDNIAYVIKFIVGQITAIFERNRANDDTSIKFGTLVLQVILIKSARLANWKYPRWRPFFKMAAKLASRSWRFA